MSRVWGSIFFLALFYSPVIGDGAKLVVSPADRLASLQKEQKEAEVAYHKAAAATPDTPAGALKDKELWKDFDKGQSDRFLAAVDLAKADPKSDVGFSALEWVLLIPRSYYLPAGKPAMELVAKHHAANPKVGKIIAKLGFYLPSERADSHAAAVDLIKQVAEKNPDRAARGQAAIAIAWQANGRFAVAEFRNTPGLETLAAQAEKAFEKVIADYADCPRLLGDEKRTLGDMVKGDLFELRHLRLGKAAPDIVGEGVDGEKFKLSDHRGKVVVVVFWASWCGPCMRMVPHERKLAARLKDEPFVIVGINGDGDRAKAKKTMADERMTWPSFWNGPEGGAGPISREWNVRGWPSVFILDKKGVIRSKETRGKEMDEVVDKLLREGRP
jgi:thiol-disulfide isomerase/thioredoxin